MKKLLILFVLTALFTACKKDEPFAKEDLYPAQPVTVPSSSAIAVFHQPTSFYQMFVYRYDADSKTWTSRIASHFSTVSISDPSFLGFTNPYVADSGVAMFDMVRLYSAYTGTTNIKTVAINADQVLQFFPDFEGAKTGVVKIKTQDVILKKSAGGTITIGMSGGGTYDENTKIMDLIVTFNEAAIGGTKRNIQYKLSPTALTLN